ncbi:MAG: ABC transporter permease subunit [Chloroflexi bacterium]|nr:ABC transporter permease subunit [Chloroflexota bacterium]
MCSPTAGARRETGIPGWDRHGSPESGGAFSTAASCLTKKPLDYVMAARVVGASNLRIMWKHILPGVVWTVIVIATLTIGTVILVESILWTRASGSSSGGKYV